MKYLLPLILFACAACARMEVRVANVTGGPIKQVEIRSSAGSTTVPQIEDGALVTQQLKLKAPSDLNVNYSDASGQQFYTSSPVTLAPSDSGFLLLSITAQGTLKAVDGRKK